ncbi:MAG: cupredoxin domain-containing protein [Candidatus Binatus sp.]|uniref:cupredoxin domain-containing protein n=1 Tax=Candidatus Binatus sp. TaxID=2811406 RepID=UPI00271B0448|nr:cupredoxin domain-containing protein [Candidatus Binatus sp.]MDO8431297.1 cupredoxin domain-containing protein [Candidatus Binatus sp.]
MSKLILKKMALLASVGIFMLAGAVRTIAADAPPAAGATTATMEEPGTKAFTIVSVEANDVKFWLPSTITVDQGDKVKLTLKNQVPGSSNQHGFTIPGYNITEVVARGTPKTITFVADKTGVFPYSCQLHPAHVGGQFVVNAKK